MKHHLLAPLLLLLAAGLAACGGDDDAEPATDAPGAGSTAPQTVGGSPAASPPPVSGAERIAASPQFLVYFAGAGDTLASVADAFDGVAPGPAAFDFAARIREANQLQSDTLAEGQPLAVPVMLPGTLSLFAENSVEAALGITGGAGRLQVLQPSLVMRDGYKNRVILHRARLADGRPAGEGVGYLLEWFLADRPAFKGGGIDPDARAAEPLFTIAAGPLASTLTSSRAGDLFRFQKDGADYTLKVFSGAQRTPAEIAVMLQTATQR